MSPHQSGSSVVSKQLEPTGRLVARTVARAALTASDRETMWRLFARYYADVSRATFDADLAKKQDVLLLLDSGSRRIAGFTTIEVYEERVDGRAFIAVFSGDTVVDDAYWGQPALKRAFARYLLKTKLSNPTRRVYWFLISKGYKTYLLLARNVANHFPRHDRDTPRFERAVIERLATRKYGAHFDPARGVLRFDDCPGRLKDGVAPIDAALLAQPDIAFFVRSNPGHKRGEELCCLGAVDLAMPVFFFGRQVKKALVSTARQLRRLWALATASL